MGAICPPRGGTRREQRGVWVESFTGQGNEEASSEESFSGGNAVAESSDGGLSGIQIFKYRPAVVKPSKLQISSLVWSGECW